MEARAMYDFRAQQEDELSFQRNDILKILQTDEVIIIYLCFCHGEYKSKENPRTRIGIGRN